MCESRVHASRFCIGFASFLHRFCTVFALVSSIELQLVESLPALTRHFGGTIYRGTLPWKVSKTLHGGLWGTCYRGTLPCGRSSVELPRKKSRRNRTITYALAWSFEAHIFPRLHHSHRHFFIWEASSQFSIEVSNKCSWCLCVSKSRILEGLSFVCFVFTDQSLEL